MSERQDIRSLRDWRVKRLLTQTELAEKVQVTAHTVGSWENGIKYPRLRHIRALSLALGVAPEQIVFPEKGKERPAA